MKKTLITTTLFLACFGVFAQALSEKDLQEIQSSFKKDASTKAIQNILTADKDIKGNALNRDLQGKIDHYFKYRADVKGITNQLSSGRCWMFTSMNVLRPSIMKKYNLSQFDFSHNHLYFWDIFEKSNLFLENIIATAKQPMDDRTVVEYFKAPVGDGGVWNLYYNAAEKYGVVPPFDESVNYLNKINDILGGSLAGDSKTIDGASTTDFSVAQNVIAPDIDIKKSTLGTSAEAGKLIGTISTNNDDR